VGSNPILGSINRELKLTLNFIKRRFAQGGFF